MATHEANHLGTCSTRVGGRPGGRGGQHRDGGDEAQANVARTPSHGSVGRGGRVDGAPAVKEARDDRWQRRWFGRGLTGPDGLWGSATVQETKYI